LPSVTISTWPVITTVALRWSRLFQPRLTGDAAVGISHFETLAAPVARNNFLFADGGFSWAFEHSALGLRYNHTITQTFGVGQNLIADSVRLNYSINAGQKVSAVVSGFYTNFRNFSQAAVNFQTETSAASLTWQASRSVSTGLNYQYIWRSQFATIPSFGTHLGTVFIRWGILFR
jgi:hypothetical protein